MRSGIVPLNLFCILNFYYRDLSHSIAFNHFDLIRFATPKYIMIKNYAEILFYKIE